MPLDSDEFMREDREEVRSVRKKVRKLIEKILK